MKEKGNRMNKSDQIQIIAELAWAHDGEIDKAIKILRASCKSGANFFGIHVTNMDAYMVRRYGSGEGRVSAGKEENKIFDYLSQINLSHGDLLKLKKEADEQNIGLCIMANDVDSFNFSMDELKPSMLALSAASFTEMSLVELIAKANLPTVLRIGGATIPEIHEVLQHFKASSSFLPTLLHGVQNYPTSLSDTNLRQLSVIKEMFGCPFGLADHLDADDQFAKMLPALAVPLGASIIEKHITYDRSEKGEDFEAALNPTEFKEFVQNVRYAELALGNTYIDSDSSSNRRYREVSRKKVVAINRIQIGDTLDKSNIALKRSDFGDKAINLEKLYGQIARTNYDIDDGVYLGDVQ